MLKKIRFRLERTRAVVRRSVWTRVGAAAWRLSTWQAERRLRHDAPLTILVDNSVLGHGITHETAWVSTGTSKWGPHEVDTGYAARIPVSSPHADGRTYQEVRYLPGIARLAKLGHLRTCSSSELEAEVFRQPIGRFTGYGTFDLNIFSGVRRESVDGFHFDLRDGKQKQFRRMEACQDEQFLQLVALLGQKNNLDAWHILTAERHGLYCFLTMDFKLADQVQRLAHKEPLQGMKTKVLTPSQLGKQLGILPIDTNLLTFVDSSWFAHPEFSWPDNARKRPRRKQTRM